jgi:hypothetical protein
VQYLHVAFVSQLQDRVFMFQPGVNVAEVIHAISGEAGEGAKVGWNIPLGLC